MTRSRSRFAPLSAIAFFAAVLGCADTVGVPGEGTVQVTMHQADGAALVQYLDGMYLSAAEAAARPLDRDNVVSLTVVVTGVEFLPVAVEDGGEDEASWMELDLPGPVELDLMALPTEGESPLVIAAGSVEAGDYRNVRFLIGGATIVFDQPFTIGIAQFDGEHDVTVPSGANTGLKTDVAFTVSSDQDGNPEELHILFHPASTFLNATATGNGKVMLAPVLRAAGQ